MSFTYCSEETGDPVTVICRFCERLDSKKVPAVAVAGQWEGGDNDVEPHWVPVCADHQKRWFVDAETGYVVPEESRLPVLPLPATTGPFIVSREI